MITPKLAFFLYRLSCQRVPCCRSYVQIVTSDRAPTVSNYDPMCLALRPFVFQIAAELQANFGNGKAILGIWLFSHFQATSVSISRQGIELFSQNTSRAAYPCTEAWSVWIPCSPIQLLLSAKDRLSLDISTRSN